MSSKKNPQVTKLSESTLTDFINEIEARRKKIQSSAFKVKKQK